MALRRSKVREPALQREGVQDAPPRDPYATRHGFAGMARSKGLLSGLLLALLGIWAAIIPFVGPYFDFGYPPDTTWTWTAARFWFQVLPGIVTLAGALLLMFSANRAIATLGAAGAAVSGAWLILGPIFAPQLGAGDLGNPIATGGWERVLTQIGVFFGVGSLILYLASTALGRLSVRGVRDVRAAERRHMRRHAEPVAADRGYTEAGTADRRDAETDHHGLSPYEQGRRDEAAMAGRRGGPAPADTPLTPRDGAADAGVHDGHRDGAVQTDGTVDGVTQPAGRHSRR